MKLKLTGALLLLAGMVSAQQLSLDGARAYYIERIQKGTAEDKAKVLAEVKAVLKTTKKEVEYETGLNFLYRLEQKESADSLAVVIAKKFPKGKLARDKYATDVYYKQEGAAAKEKSFNTWMKKWPKENFEGIKIAYDYVIADLAKAFADEGNKEKALQYLGQMNERFWRAQGYIPVATKFLQSGDTAAALPLIQTAIDDAVYYIQLPKEKQDNQSGFAAVGYPGYIAQLVEIKMAQGQYVASLSLIEDAIALSPKDAERFSGVYYKALQHAGRKLEALQQLEILYKAGNFGHKETIKQLFTELNGSSTGFDAYIARLDKDVVKMVREHIAKYEKNDVAPAFELLNLEGEKVPLASLKGKVVVLDFWATWCQPCVRSFPGMKAAQDNYAQDDEVQFLFINTWERDKNYKTNVAAFIKNNNYPFEVLFDDAKNEQGKNLAAEFGVSGIPAKFIIDKEGKIRYALTGSSANIDYIKLEMTELIESAKKNKS